MTTGDSTQHTHKGVDGKATLTDTHLIFEYNILGRVPRNTKRSEIPLSDITSFEIVPGSITYLRVGIDGAVSGGDPAQSARAIALHPRKPHDKFLSALKAATGASRSVSSPVAPAPSAPTYPTAKFGGYSLRNGVLTGGGKSVGVLGATAEATQGVAAQRSTLTRMGAGALIGGRIGAVVGATARKDTSKCYVTVEFPDGVVVIEGKAKDYPDAVIFASAVNRSQL